MYQPFFHVGILVRDIEAAVGDFATRLGVEFEPVMTGQLATGHSSTYCYSLQGPPFFELMQMADSGPFAGSEEGFHHVGFGEADLAGRCAAFDNRVQPIVLADGGAPRVFYTDPADFYGLRLEYVAADIATRRTAAGLRLGD